MAHTATAPAQPSLVRVSLDEFKWPSGMDRSLVVLHAEPNELTGRYGIGFRHDLDNLDYNRVSVGRLPSGRCVMFIRYYRSPGPGTEVRTDFADSPAAAWEELRSVLRIDDSATSWQSELLHGAISAPQNAA